MSVWLRAQGGPMARRAHDQGLHATAQHSAARGGRRHRPQPITSLSAPEQGHAHENAEARGPLHLVRQEAARDSAT